MDRMKIRFLTFFNKWYLPYNGRLLITTGIRAKFGSQRWMDHEKEMSSPMKLGHVHHLRYDFSSHNIEGIITQTVNYTSKSDLTTNVWLLIHTIREYVLFIILGFKTQFIFNQG